MLHSPITSDTAGSTYHATYGFLLDTTKREWTVLDVNARYRHCLLRLSDSRSFMSKHGLIKFSSLTGRYE